MRTSFKHSLFKLASVAVVASALSGCDAVYEDLPDCDRGVNLRFVYDYNMEFANAFHNQVDCLTVYIYDADTQRYVATYTETGDPLKDESYRMPIELPAGRYRAIAYGGIGCEESHFSHPHEIPSADFDHIATDLEMRLNEGAETNRLHDLFYGQLTFEVADTDTRHRELTLPMVKDTNHYRFLLHNISGVEMDGNDFEFRIEDNNSRLGHDNEPLEAALTTYRHWARGSVTMEDIEEANERAALSGDATRATATSLNGAYGELSTSRLHMGLDPRLVITYNPVDGSAEPRDVIDIPLRKYLLMMKSEYYSKMDDQEFLDRTSNWNVIFLLDKNNVWIETRIIVNNWVVRLNSYEAN